MPSLASDHLGRLRKALPSSIFTSTLGLHYIKNTVQKLMSKGQKRNTSWHLWKTKFILSLVHCSPILTTTITFLNNLLWPFKNWNLGDFLWMSNIVQEFCLTGTLSSKGFLLSHFILIILITTEVFVSKWISKPFKESLGSNISRCARMSFVHLITM